jgi:chaperonin GroEL
MSRQILEGESARRALARGAEQLAFAVRVTLGPRGRTVLIERGQGGPSILNDGAAVAHEVELPDPFENLGARLVREAARKTFEDAGDGTSTATVLAQAILAHGLARVRQGASPVQLKRGLELAARAASAHVRTQARPLATREERLAVAAIGAAGDLEVARRVEDAVERVGPAGAVSIRAGRSRATGLEIVPGLRFDRGYLSAYFVTAPEEMRAALERPLVLLADQKLERAEQVAPALEAAQAAGAPLLVIAEDVEGEALQTLVLNQLRGVARSCAVQAPDTRGRRRAFFERVAAGTGASVHAPDLGRSPESVTIDELGRLERALIDRGSTTLVFGDEARGEDSGIAVIDVGGENERAIEDARARHEDALAALSNAVAEGIVPGGGVALVRARDATISLPLEGDAKAGAESLARALLEPARWIAQNAGADGDAVVAALLRSSGATGYDAALGAMVDLARAGIVDPARVVRLALENAASVAGLLLATETLVVGEDEPDPEPRPD